MLWNTFTAKSKVTNLGKVFGLWGEKDRQHETSPVLVSSFSPLPYKWSILLSYLGDSEVAWSKGAATVFECVCMLTGEMRERAFSPRYSNFYSSLSCYSSTLLWLNPAFPNIQPGRRCPLFMGAPVCSEIQKIILEDSHKFSTPLASKKTVT